MLLQTQLNFFLALDDFSYFKQTKPNQKINK